VDVATLTGACQVALGDRFTGAFSNNDELMAKTVQASILAGENIWRLPMGDDEYSDLNASSVADIANCGKKCGAIAAARFLNAFVEKKPWLHLDIAGTSESDEDKEIYAKGGTGAAAMLLYELVKLTEKPYKSY
ncbi:MAG: aminopeptidase, partial [Eubacterium sp.]|nr:aminopeptidase [Eubacterium sp.]